MSELHNHDTGTADSDTGTADNRAQDGEHRREQLRAGLEKTKQRIADIAAKAGRPSPDLLVVTKFHSVEDIALLGELGVTDVGENREQEARAKAEKLPDMNFHMIGQIQTKKANHVARWAHSVHSLDSEKLARGLDRGVALAVEREQRTSEILPVYIQVSADGDTARGGVAIEELEELARLVQDLEHLDLRGLMVVPPLESDPSEIFSAIRTLCDELGEKLGLDLRLSAGMSADLEEAINSGSNVVRVGTDVMGQRPLG